MTATMRETEGLLDLPGFMVTTASSTVSKVSEVDYPERKRDHYNLRVLSVYNGEAPEPHTKPGEDADIIKGTVDIEIHPETKPIILVLMPTTWRIHLANDKAKIKKVIAVGYFPQKVDELTPDVELEQVYHPLFKGQHKNVFEPFIFSFRLMKMWPEEVGSRR